MTSSHERKRTLFFFCPSVILFLWYSSFISLEDIGRKISGLLTPIVWTSFCFEFWLETGEFEEKVKKEVFWMGKNRQIFLFLYHVRPQVSLTISQGSIIFFLLEDMSVKCLSLLTNPVGRVRSYNLWGNSPFFLSSGTIFFFTYSGKGFDHPNLLRLLCVKCALRSSLFILLCFLSAA